MSKLPNNWYIAPLGEVCKTVKGRKPKNSGPLSEERTIPYINIKAFETGKPEEYAEPGEYPECKRDEVLIVWDGARAGLTGRGVAGYIGSTLAKVWCEATKNSYLYYFLQAQYGRINSRTKGVGIPHVDPTIFFSTDFPIAPVTEQERIVAEIEKQFSRLDEAVANLKRVKANLKRYKAAVLKAAVEGKLTEAWRKQHPNVEPATKLLERILTERRAKWNGKGKYKEPIEPDTTGFPLLPEGWIWAPLESITEAVGGFAFESKKFTLTGFQVLKMANVRMGRIDLDQKPSFIQDVEPNVIARYGLMEGDLVVTLTGTRKKQDYGYVAVVKNAKNVLLNQRIARLRPADGVLPEFLAFVMQSEEYRNRFFAYETGNVGQGNVGIGAVTKEPIRLSPFAEQQYIVAEVERRLSVIDELETTVEANLTRADRLRQSVLSQAFSGRLLGQDTKHIQDILPTFSIAVETQARYGRADRARR